MRHKPDGYEIISVEHDRNAVLRLLKKRKFALPCAQPAALPILEYPIQRGVPRAVHGHLESSASVLVALLPVPVWKIDECGSNGCCAEIRAGHMRT